MRNSAQSGFVLAVVVVVILFSSVVIAGPSLYSYFTSGSHNDLKSVNNNFAVVAREQLTPSPVQNDKARLIANEATREKNDQIRLAELSALKKILEAVSYGYMVEDSITPIDFCVKVSDVSLPCFGSSLRNGTKTDGNGWIRADLRPVSSLTSLPVDPINTESYHFSYCANRTQWEIVAVLESQKEQERMKTDGGNDPTKYEIGTNLNLFGPQGKCRY